MSVYREGDRFVAEVTVAGKRYRKRVSSHAEGARWVATTKALGHPPAELAKAKHPLGKVAREALRAGRDPSQGQRLEVALGFFGLDTDTATVDRERLNAFVRFLEQRKGRDGSPLSPATINRYLSVVSAVLTHAAESGYIVASPAIPWQDEPLGRTETLSPAQEDALASALGPRLGLCLRVLTATGMRAGEFFNLEPGQIDGEWVRLWETKTDRPRSVPLSAALGRLLRAMLDAGELPAHAEFYRSFKRAAASLGLSEALTVHSTRHTTGSRLAGRGVQGPVIQKFLGHSNYRTTQRYVHLADEDLMRAAEKLEQGAPTVGRVA